MFRLSEATRVVLFDIRTDSSHAGYVAAVNHGLDSAPGNPYLSRFGHVCSPQWWACIDRGELSVEVNTGAVTFVGRRFEDWSREEQDVVEFTARQQTFAYDRVNHWARVPIRVGDRIVLTQTVAELVTRTGPVRYIIDIRAEWLPAAQEPRQTEPSAVADPARDVGSGS